VLFAVPGAFTPGCQAKHLPPYIEKYNEFKSKGVDIVAVISANDAFVPISTFPLCLSGC
jgi:alkyl hydroperoxide reductase 1